MAVHHHVDHAMLIEIFRALEALGQLLANGLLDHARAGKADAGAGFGNMHIAQHGVGRGHPARGGVGEHHKEGQARFTQAQHGNRGARHLHQAEHAFLHARATRGDEQHERCLAIGRRFQAGDDALTRRHAERTAHEVEILHGYGDVTLVELARCHQYGVFVASLGPAFLEAVGIAFLVAEFQRVDRHAGHADQFVLAFVEEILEPVCRLDLHVVARIGHDPLVRLEIAIKHHLAGLGILDPQILGNLRLVAQDGADFGADEIIDPVHGGPRAVTSASPKLVIMAILIRGGGQGQRRRHPCG